MFVSAILKARSKGDFSHDARMAGQRGKGRQRLHTLQQTYDATMHVKRRKDGTQVEEKKSVDECRATSQMYEVTK